MGENIRRMIQIIQFRANVIASRIHRRKATVLVHAMRVTLLTQQPRHAYTILKHVLMLSTMISATIHVSIAMLRALHARIARAVVAKVA